MNIGCVGDLYLILFYFKYICNCMLIMLFGNWDKIIKFYLNYLCEIFFGNKLKLVGFVNVKSIKFL